jgi:hypothetical protein
MGGHDAESGDDPPDAEDPADGSSANAPSLAGADPVEVPDDPTPEDLDRAALDVKAEGKQFAAAALRDKNATAALLKYIDSDLADPGFVMPYFEDPHGTVTYLAGIVQLRRLAQDTRQRKTLTGRVTSFAAMWILAVLVIVVLVGATSFHLPEAVLVTLLGTTTANVLGLTVIVLKGMYDREPPDFVRHLEATTPPPRRREAVPTPQPDGEPPPEPPSVSEQPVPHDQKPSAS